MSSNNYYKISDFNVAAYLYLLSTRAVIGGYYDGIEFKGIEKGENGRYNFLFDGFIHFFEKIEREFYEGKREVDALSYVNARKNLKSALETEKINER